MIIALAGRRIDAPNTERKRFPPKCQLQVRENIQELFLELKPETLVCSAASGADLIALEVAEDLAIDRQIILPFAPRVFRRTSVADRPGDWGKRFDRLLATMKSRDALLCLNRDDRGYSAYRAVNEKIVEHAQTIARKQRTSVTAVIMWDGQSWGVQDITSQFRQAALEAGFQVKEVCTLG